MCGSMRRREGIMKGGGDGEKEKEEKVEGRKGEREELLCSRRGPRKKSVITFCLEIFK